MSCNFYISSTYPAQILQAHDNDTNLATTQVVIKNTNFTSYQYLNIQDLDQNLNASFSSLLHTTLLIEDSVLFCNISTLTSIITLKGNSI